ncbi:replication factor C large subunit [Candidatus Pacearchaeota archaeon]|nr:replication factor C large subunit [Candidatus Pacearchaeota archaeon]
MIPLFEKYRPRKFIEVKGQEIPVDKIKAFLSNFNKDLTKKKAILLYGPAGTGKTTLAIVAAQELGFELFELNASDLRNRKKLDEVLKPSTEQLSLFNKGKIILVDEVDGVTSTLYGGIAELIALIEKTKFPMIITCNDIWQTKFNLLRTKCEMVGMKEVPYNVTLDIIKEVCKKENKFITEDLIKEISAKARGDLRAALNDLQSVMNIQGMTLEEISIREKSQDIFNALKELFKIRTNQNTLEIYNNVDLELDQISLWVEENIPKEYRGEELAKAFDALSKADLFKGRIYKQQYWHFLVYQNFFLSAGISSAKGAKNLSPRFTKYNPPSRILKIWMANQRNAKKKAIAMKYAELTHTNKNRAMRDFNLIALMIDDNAIRLMQLEEPEIEFLKEKQQELKALASA